jgi:hypothetical protein
MRHRSHTDATDDAVRDTDHRNCSYESNELNEWDEDPQGLLMAGFSFPEKLLKAFVTFVGFVRFA